MPINAPPFGRCDLFGHGILGDQCARSTGRNAHAAHAALKSPWRPRHRRIGASWLLHPDMMTDALMSEVDALGIAGSRALYQQSYKGSWSGRKVSIHRLRFGKRRSAVELRPRTSRVAKGPGTDR